MPAGVPQFGEGVLLEVNDGAANAFVSVTELESLTPPGSMVRSVERKRLTVTGVVERWPSPRKDNGECQFTYEMTDAIQIRLNDLISVFGKSWRVTYPDGLRFAFTGWLSSAKPGQVQAEDFSKGQGSIVINSLIVITDETP